MRQCRKSFALSSRRNGTNQARLTTGEQGSNHKKRADASIRLTETITSKFPPSRKFICTLICRIIRDYKPAFSVTLTQFWQGNSSPILNKLPLPPVPTRHLVAQKPYAIRAEIDPNPPHSDDNRECSDLAPTAPFDPTSTSHSLHRRK